MEQLVMMVLPLIGRTAVAFWLCAGAAAMLAAGLVWVARK